MEEDVEQLLLKRQYSQAFRRLLDRYSNKVFRMACVMLKDPGRAEEVTQDIFVKIWQVLPNFDGRAAVSTWLYAIARNACLSALRSESYRRTIPLDEAKAIAIKNTSAMDISVRQCLSRLPETQRVVLTLFYFEDQRVEEIATMLNMPAGTVKSHLHRARRALVEMME